jgi:hypothetical protein
MNNLLRFIAPHILVLLVLAHFPGTEARAGGQDCRQCFRARPLPECKSFFITDFGYLYRLARNTGAQWYQGDKNFYFLGDVGWMHNLDRQNALGATLFYGADDDGSRLAIKPRYRRWLNDKMSLDFSAGLIFRSFDNLDKSPGFTGHIAFNFSEWAAVTTQLEIRPRSKAFLYYNPNEKKTEIAWYGGFRICSYPGLAAIVIAPLTVLIYTIATIED